MSRDCGSRAKEDVVVSVGRIAPDKRTTDIIDMMETAYSRYPKAAYYVIGLPYNEAYLRQVKERVRHVELVLECKRGC